MRTHLRQLNTWPMPGAGPYSREHCCYCGRPVDAGAKLLHLTRTNDGEWWLVTPDEPTRDEGAYGPRFELPIGAGCLKRNPFFRRFLVHDGYVAPSELHRMAWEGGLA